MERWSIVAEGRTSTRESRPTTVFRAFRRYLAATEEIDHGLRSLTLSLDKLCQAQQELGPASERLEALELSRHQWEAKCEGLLLKAEGKLRAANNAEARERALRKTYEHLLDPLSEVGDTPEAPARSPSSNDDDPPSAEDRMLGVRMAVASTNPKTLAQRAKFGLR